MSVQIVSRALALVTMLTVFVGAGPALAQPFELSVKKDQFFGSSTGTLIVGPDTVEYRTSHADDARVWRYEDVKQVQILSPTKVTIKTYEDQGWIKFGADRSFEFDITEGSVSEDIVQFLLGRVQRPMVTALLPASAGEPIFRVLVKLRRRLRGSHGALALFDDHLVYETERVGHARSWRSADLYTVFQPDRHRLNVEVYEGGGDKRRTFSFDLKEELPPGFLEALWRRIYVPSLARIGSRDESR